MKKKNNKTKRCTFNCCNNSKRRHNHNLNTENSLSISKKITKRNLKLIAKEFNNTNPNFSKCYMKLWNPLRKFSNWNMHDWIKNMQKLKKPCIRYLTPLLSLIFLHFLVKHSRDKKKIIQVVISDSLKKKFKFDCYLIQIFIVIYFF